MYARIRELRKSRHITQQQIADALGCSQRIYSNYERGEIDLSSKMLIKLGDFHEVSIDYLLNRTNTKEMH